jgi:hypothetical protein
VADLTEKEEKAVGIVADERVTIDYSSDEVVTATVEGETGTYRVTIDPSGEKCDCKANRLGHHRCSHIIGVEVAVAMIKEGDEGDQ